MCSSNFALPSSIHNSIAKAPDSRLLTGVVLNPPKSFPIFVPRATSFSSWASSRVFLCFCRPGSAAIHGVFGPKGGCTPPSSRSSATRVKEQSEGSGDSDEDSVDNLAKVARNCSGRSVAGGGLSAKDVRSSEDGTDGKAAVENRKRSSAADEGGGA